jgi:hypothetical protein
MPLTTSRESFITAYAKYLKKTQGLIFEGELEVSTELVPHFKAAGFQSRGNTIFCCMGEMEDLPSEELAYAIREAWKIFRRETLEKETKGKILSSLQYGLQMGLRKTEVGLVITPELEDSIRESLPAWIELTFSENVVKLEW